MQEFSDIFAWSHINMPSISLTIAQHYLHLQIECKSIHQKLGQFHLAYREVIKKKVDNFIREIQYPEWLSNVVVVPMKNGKWHVCVDYSNLNDACQKYTFPLPRIDQIMDATTGHQLLSFLDVCSGFNQIPMYPPDSVNKAFITLTGMYC